MVESLEGRALLTTINPGDVVIASSQYVDDEFVSRLAVIDRKTGVSTALPQPFGDQTTYYRSAVQVGLDGKVYALAYGFDDYNDVNAVSSFGLYRIDPETSTSTQLQDLKPKKLTQPGHSEYVITPDGDLIVENDIYVPFFGNPLPSRLLRVDAETGEVTQLPQPFGGDTFYYNIAAGLDGMVYATAIPNSFPEDQGFPPSRIYRIDPSAGSISELPNQVGTGSLLGAGKNGDFVLLRLDEVQDGDNRIDLSTLSLVSPSNGTTKVLSQPFGATTDYSYLGYYNNNASFGSDGVFVVQANEYTGGGDSGVYRFDPALNTSTLLARFRRNVTDAVSVAPERPVVLQVTADHDDEASERVFGRYLEGIKLDTEFTVDAGRDLPDGYTLSYQIGTSGAVNVTNHPDARHWTFTINPGNLGARDDDGYPLLITLRNDRGESASTFGGKIQVKNSLGFELKASYPGGSETAVPVGDLRFLRDIAFTPTFQGTVTGLPTYYADRFNFLRLGNQAQDQVPITLHKENGFRSWSFSGVQDDVANLPTGKTDAVLLFRNDQGGLSSRSSFGTAPLLAIDLPSWMGTPTSKTFQPSVDASVFGTKVGAYELTLSVPPGLQDRRLPLDAIEGIASEIYAPLFDGLTSSFQIGLNLVVYARPTVADEAKVKVGQASAQVQILAGAGNDPVVLEQAKVAADLPEKLLITANLDRTTLDTKNLVITTDGPVDLKQYLPANGKLFAIPFGDSRQLVLPLPIFGAGNVIKFKAKASLAGEFRGDVTRLDVTPTIQLDVTKGSLSLNLNASTIALNVGAKATLVLKEAKAEGGFTLLNIVDVPLVTVAAEGNLSAALAGGWTVNFAGKTVQADATLTLGAYLKYDVCFFDSDCPPGESDYEPFNPTPYVIPLNVFDRPTPRPRSFGDADSVETTGVANPSDAGYPGVLPTQGDAMTTLNLAPATLITTFASPAPSVRLITPVDGSLGSIRYDLNVLADRENLTPGRHLLESVLVGDDGEVLLDRRDLAGTILKSNVNQLGFAGGWRTVDVVVPTGQLVPGHLYSLAIRLLTDPGSAGERVAVALDNVNLIAKPPALDVSGPLGGLADGRIDFGVDTADPALGILRLANTGTGYLEVDALRIVGAGYVLVDDVSGTFYLPPGMSLDLRIRRLDPTSGADGLLTIASDDPTQPLRTFVLAAPPIVSRAVVNEFAPQRSNLEVLALPFSEATDVPALIASGAITDLAEVYALSPTVRKIYLGSDHYRWDEPTHTLRIDLTIDGFGGSSRTLLSDGRYEVRLRTSAIHDAVGASLLDTDGVSDGSLGFAFHRLFGDADGDGDVDNSDALAFKSALNKTVGQDGYLGFFDLDGNGIIDAFDFAEMKKRYGKRI